MGYYDQLKATDIVDWVKDLLDKSLWTWRYEDGKIVAQVKPGVSETPWHHIKPDHRLQCAKWHQIMFDIVAMRGPLKFVPSRCQQCFKVVVRPKTLQQLFALMEMQIKMDRPSKCGIELRDSVHGLYGGYFYNIGLAEGLECYEAVRAEVDNTPTLGPETEVFLKRACTEYEHACGDSDTWEITEEQLHIEALVDRHIEVECREVNQPKKLIHHVHRRWIEYAYGRGDETYKLYTDDKPLYRKYKSYEHWLPVLKQQGVDAIKLEGK